MELFANETALNCRTLSCEALDVMANSPTRRKPKYANK